MSIVNFTIATPLEKKIQKVIKEQGFASKAEFFRFAAMSFIQKTKAQNIDELFEKEMDDFAKKIAKKYGDKKLPPIEEQFDQLLDEV
jgi:metal-responsive CopG/Arc/MetJ family transcriptional regulator